VLKVISKHYNNVCFISSDGGRSEISQAYSAEALVLYPMLIYIYRVRLKKTPHTKIPLFSE